MQILVEKAVIEHVLEALVEADGYYDYDATVIALREALDPELQFVRDWNEGKVRRVSDGKVMGVAEQAEQEPVDKVGITHDLQLVETFLRCPMTGKQLYFASEPIQKKGMNYMRLQDGEGNDWTLIARLDEGWDGK